MGSSTIRDDDPAIRVSSKAGTAGAWLDACRPATHLERVIEDAVGRDVADSATWIIAEHTGFCGLEPTSEWPLDLLSAVATGIRDEGDTFAEWVSEVGVESFTERAATIQLLYNEAHIGTFEGRGDFARHQISARGGLSALSADEVEDFFDYDAYAKEHYRHDPSLLMVRTTRGLSVYEIAPRGGTEPAAAPGITLN